MDLVVVANQPGYYLVKAAVFSDQDGHFSMSDEVYVEIDEQGTVFPGKPLPYWDLRYAYPMPENNALVSTELLIEPEPALGSQFDLIFRATPLADMTAERALQITVALPREGLKLLSARFPQGGESHQMSDQVNWQGTAVRGQTVELRLRLQVDQTGWGQVIGMLHGQTNAPNPQRVTDTLIAEIFAGEHQGSYSVKRP